MKDAIFRNFGKYIKIYEEKTIDKEKLALNGKVLSIKLESYNARRVFDKLENIKPKRKPVYYFLEFNKYGNIIHSEHYFAYYENPYISLYDYDEKNNVIRVYNGYNESFVKSKDFLDNSYMYDENDNLIKEYSYYKYGKRCKQYENRNLFYTDNLLIKDKSTDGSWITNEYNENKLIILQNGLSNLDGNYIQSKKEFFYNAKNQLIKEIKEISFRSTIKTYRYDELGNIIELKIVEPSSPPIHIEGTFQNDYQTCFIPATSEELIYQELNEFDESSNVIRKTVHNKKKDSYQDTTFKYNKENVLIQKSEYDKSGKKTAITIFDYSDTNKILFEKTYYKDGSFITQQFIYDEYNNLIRIIISNKNEEITIHDISILYY